MAIGILPILLILVLLFNLVSYIWLTKKQRKVVFIIELIIFAILVVTKPSREIDYAGLAWAIYILLPSIVIDFIIKVICILKNRNDNKANI